MTKFSKVPIYDVRCTCRTMILKTNIICMSKVIWSFFCPAIWSFSSSGPMNPSHWYIAATIIRFWLGVMVFCLLYLSFGHARLRLASQHIHILPTVNTQDSRAWAGFNVYSFGIRIRIIWGNIISSASVLSLYYIIHLYYCYYIGLVHW